MSDGREGYSIMYRLGFRPWEFDPTPRYLVEVAAGLSVGRALELGCGTGRQAVELAGRGWQVTAVDYVPLAIDQARSRASAAGAEVRFVVGDVTRLGELDLGAAFDLIFDNKCFHGLPAASRRAYAAGVAASCRPGGTFLLFALAHGGWRQVLGLPAGVDPDDVQRLFEPDFEFSRREAGKGGPFQPAFYQMSRRSPVVRGERTSA